MGVPAIQLNESGGGRVQEGARWFSFSDLFLQQHPCLGRSSDHGNHGGECRTRGVWGRPHGSFFVDDLGEMYITGPAVIKAVTSEEISYQDLGGAKIHTQETGIGDLRLSSERECIAQIRRLLSFLPQNWKEPPPRKQCTDDPHRAEPILNDIVPSNYRQVLNMRKIIDIIVDDQDFFEIKPEYARNIMTGFARFGGRPVGIIANQSTHLGVPDRGIFPQEFPLCPFLQCLQYSHAFPRRYAGYLPGWPRSMQDHPAWGEAAVCRVRIDGPENHRRDP